MSPRDYDPRDRPEVGDTEGMRRHVMHHWAERQGIGRVPLDRSTFNRWSADLEPGEPAIWEHEGGRFEVIRAEPYRDGEGAVYLIVRPLDGGPNAKG